MLSSRVSALKPQTTRCPALTAKLSETGCCSSGLLPGLVLPPWTFSGAQGSGGARGSRASARGSLWAASFPLTVASWERVFYPWAKSGGFTSLVKI